MERACITRFSGAFQDLECLPSSEEWRDGSRGWFGPIAVRGIRVQEDQVQAPLNEEEGQIFWIEYIFL